MLTLTQTLILIVTLTLTLILSAKFYTTIIKQILLNSAYTLINFIC